jgi:hypothetical protein
MTRTFASARRSLLLLAWLVVGLTGGCRHGEYKAGVFSKSNVRYRIGEVPPGWKLIGLKENDLAYESADGAHWMAVNSTCEGHGDAPLEVLTRQLLAGFSDRELIGQEIQPLDGRDSLRSHYRAKLDGVPVELMLVVTKKDGCVYDFTYVSPVGRYPERLGDFERLLQNFHTEGPR